MKSTLMLPAFSKRYVTKHLTLAIVILSLAIRFGASLFLTNLNDPPQNDGLIFTKIAWNLVSGNGYSMNGEVPTAVRLPGYPFLLAGVFFIFGQSWVAARVTNILISSLTVGMIYLISRKLFNRNIGLAAALISGFHPTFIRCSLRIISDTLYAFMISIVLFTFIEIYDRPNSLRTRLICGVLLGVAILTRSELLLFVPFLFIWALLAYRQFYIALRTVVVIMLPALLFVLPWLIRNYIVFDGFMMAANLGRVMWGVHNPDTFTDESLMGAWHPPELGIRNAGSYSYDSWDPAYRYLPELEWNQQQVELAMKSIMRNIRLLPKMEIYKLHRLFFTSDPIRDLAKSPILYCFFFGLILLLASGDKRFLIFYMLMLSAVFSTLIFYTSGRLRMGVEPALIIIASYGLSEQIKLVRQKYS